jgi:hypothetical protein
MAGMNSSSPRRGRHELGPDGVGDHLAQDAIDSRPGGGVERPTCYTERSLQLIGVTAAPKCHADALVEHPAHGQVNHASVEVIPCELIELPNGCEVLCETGRLELRVESPQIVALEGGVLLTRDQLLELSRVHSTEGRPSPCVRASTPSSKGRSSGS